MKITPEWESRKQANAMSINRCFREELDSDDNHDLPIYSDDRTQAVYAPFARYSAVAPYQPVPMQVHDCRHVVKAIFASTQSVPSLTNILGTYLTCKANNQRHRSN